jgi:hypothetical protein
MMDQRTREALEKSIAHWEDNVAADRPSHVYLGPQCCALCDLFRFVDIGGLARCDGCPVFTRTQEHGCKGSPYDEADNAFDAWSDIYLDDYFEAEKARLKWRSAACAELDFLKSLR